MYISEKARLISSILSSFTFSDLHLSDLESLKEEIDYMIKSNVNNIKPKTLYDISMPDVTYHQSTDFKYNITFQLPEQKTIPQSLFKSEWPEVSLYAPISESFKKIKQTTSTEKSPRNLGIWKGQIEISEDFYNTSNDILSEFGIEE